MKKVLGHRWAVVVMKDGNREEAVALRYTADEAKALALAIQFEVPQEDSVRVAPVELVEEG